MPKAKKTITEYRVSYGAADSPHHQQAVGVTYLRSALAIVDELRHQGDNNVRLWTREVTPWVEVE